MKTVTRGLTSALALLPFLVVVVGCQNNEIPLAKPDQTVIINPVKAEDLPKELKPGAGSSSGMNYDPSGMHK